MQAGTDSKVDIEGGNENIDAADALASETREYQLEDQELIDAGTQYAVANIVLFILPLIGIFYFLHFFCYKDSLGKRRRLVWAINLIMIYSLLNCIL